jgi:ribosomal protein S14
MEPATAVVRPTVSSRVVACLWCRQDTTQADVLRHHGLCRSCVRDNVEVSWRLVYDRDRNIGAIPSNLRLAYRL